MTDFEKAYDTYCDADAAFFRQKTAICNTCGNEVDIFKGIISFARGFECYECIIKSEH